MGLALAFTNTIQTIGYKFHVITSVIHLPLANNPKLISTCY
jgi:hypothetical protein